MALNRWWKSRAGEKYWLEVTRRPDLGADLKAPQNNEHGREFWSYSLVKEVEAGDVVFHYDGVAQAIVARSVAVGTHWEGELLWAARGASARAANVMPHPRPGWYLGLERFEQLHEGLPLEAMRQRSEEIRHFRNALAEQVGEPLYFPFELSKSRPMRPMQGYLFKLPAEFVDLFHLDEDRQVPPPSQGMIDLGAPYREADELTTVTTGDPFAIDPALVERGVRGHAVTQNSLARHLRALGMDPRSPLPSEPNFDLAWRHDTTRYVAEVKSITAANEEKQLRLGLGQVLRYAYQLGPGTVPVLMLEHQPVDRSWEALCERLGVIVVWPEYLAEKFWATPSKSTSQSTY